MDFKLELELKGEFKLLIGIWIGIEIENRIIIKRRIRIINWNFELKIELEFKGELELLIEIWTGISN